MSNVSIEIAKSADLDAILREGEELIWSGQPDYGTQRRERIGAERVYARSMLVGAIVLWCTFPLIVWLQEVNAIFPFISFTIYTLFFAVTAYTQSGVRQFVMQNSLYFLTNERAIIFRRGRNSYAANRLYILSCDHSPGNPYELVETYPFKTLRVGTLLSSTQIQPLGFGLSHPGQPPLWNRMYEPVAFEQVSNAEELLQEILTILSSEHSPSG